MGFQSLGFAQPDLYPMTWLKPVVYTLAVCVEAEPGEPDAPGDLVLWCPNGYLEISLELK